MGRNSSNAPSRISFFVMVESILRDSELRQKLAKECPELYDLLEKYYKTYRDRERYAKVLESVILQLERPDLSVEDMLRLELEKSRIIDYLQALNEKLKKLEEKIKEITSYPKCQRLIPTPVTVPSQASLAEGCDDFNKLMTILQSIQDAVAPHLNQFGRPQLIANFGFFCYTDHGIDHVQRVLDNSKKILSDLEVELNEIEDSLLKIAIYYHDHALNRLPTGLELENVADINQVRQRHSQLGREQWEKDFDEIYKGQLKKYLSQQDLQRIKNSVAYVIDNHSGEFYESRDVEIEICNEKYRIRVNLLSAVLRIADEIDMGYERLPCLETMNLCIALGGCYESYSKSIPHYITNGIVDYIEIENHVIIVSLHPFREIVIFYPSVADKSLFIAYSRESYETLPVALRKDVKNVFFIKEGLSSKLRKELDLVNRIFLKYGLPKLQYELNELYPVDIISKIDREIIIKGVKSLLNSPDGRNMLAKCGFVEKLKAPQDIYTILETR